MREQGWALPTTHVVDSHHLRGLLQAAPAIVFTRTSHSSADAGPAAGRLLNELRRRSDLSAPKSKAARPSVVNSQWCSPL